jgi:hypothetical protein
MVRCMSVFDLGCRSGGRSCSLSLTTGGYDEDASERLRELETETPSSHADPYDDLRDRVVGAVLTSQNGREFTASTRVLNADPRCAGGRVGGWADC